MGTRINVMGERVWNKCPRCSRTMCISDAFGWKTKGGIRQPKSYCLECQSACSRESYVRNLESRRAAAAAWRKAHPEKMREYSDKYWAKNVDKRRAKAKRIRDRNPEKHREQCRRWFAENRERYNQRRREKWQVEHERGLSWLYARRTRLLAAKGAASAEQIRARIEYYGGRCAYCGGEYEEVDHVIPLAKGGTNWPANLRPACTRCNRSKKDRPLDVFLGDRRAA